MKKISIFSIALVSLSIQGVYAQTHSWVKGWFPNTVNNQVYASTVSTDNQNNVYTTASFAGVVDSDPNSGVTNLNGVGTTENNVFITKLSDNGNFLWSKHLYCSSRMAVSATKSDASNNLFVFGYFIGKLEPDHANSSNTINSTGTKMNTFVIKYSSDGSFLWARNVELMPLTGNTASVDNNGHVYYIGTFQNSIDLDPTTGVDQKTASNNDLAITKLDGNGNYLWSKVFQTNAGGSGSIAVDDLNNIYVTGIFVSSMTLGNNGSTFTTPRAAQFITKISDKGDFGWTKQFNGDFYNGQYLVVDKNRNVTLGNIFSGTIDFDPGSGTHNLNAGNSIQTVDIGLVQLDKDGNFNWAGNIGNNATTHIVDLKCDQNNNIYFTGIFNGTLDFDIGSGVQNLIANKFNESFICKYSQNGSFIFGNTYSPNQASTCVTKNIEVSKNDAIYLSGSFFGDIDFDLGTGTDILSAPNGKCFVHKLNQTKQSITEDNSFKFRLYPNPASQSFNIEIPDYNKEFMVTIYDYRGQQVLNQKHNKQKKAIHISHLASGVYFIQCQTNERVFAPQVLHKL